ncbi:MAG: phytanoyl-CoA dioxygenase family protein [Pyrinomonadaceae bacterium]|nr:phytanoyl-CoA dioxygenase family protein [Pyrinomonadaceae bacterium]
MRPGLVDSGVRDYIKRLDQDGVLVINDFLSEDEFRRVRGEYRSIKPKMTFNAFRGVDDGKLQVASIALNGTDENPAISTYLRDNALILKIAASAMRREVNTVPPISLYAYRKISDAAPDNDLENVLHADLHTPTIKAFYYLNDVDESNGAFVYVKGSHRISLKRIAHEYQISVRTARLNRGDTLPTSWLAVRGPNKRVAVSQEYARTLVETSICGKANTLVIANNMGFHRRGNFANGNTREMALINFRRYEKCF